MTWGRPGGGGPWTWRGPSASRGTGPPGRRAPSTACAPGACRGRGTGPGTRATSGTGSRAWRRGAACPPTRASRERGGAAWVASAGGPATGPGRRGGASRFDGPGRAGIGGAGHERGHKRPAVVVDHDRGCLVWAHEGYGKEVLGLFPGEPAREQRRAIEVVTADGAKWTEALVRRRCPNARWVMDPSHVVEWTSDALDEAGREEWRVAKGAAQDAMPRRDGPGRPRRGEETPPGARAPGEAADATEGSRYALAGNPGDLTGSQRARLAEPGRAGGHLFAAWDPEEDPGAVFRAGTAVEAEAMPGGWPRGAACREIGPVVAVEKKAGRRRGRRCRRGAGRRSRPRGGHRRQGQGDGAHGLRSHDTDNLVALLMLRCSDGQPALPWEDRGEERRKVDERRRRDRERDRKRRRKMARGN